jgi:DUF971 family protein
MGLLDADVQEVVHHQTTGRLEIGWADGVRAQLGVAQLRSACKCAGCEHQRRQGRPHQPAEGIALSALHPIGDVGLQLAFSDGHDRGIYPWPYLRELATHSPSEHLS